MTLERLGETAGRRCGRLRKRVGAGEKFVEPVDRQLFSVGVFVVAEADRQRNDAHAVRVGDLVGEVAGGVGDDSDAHGDVSLVANRAGVVVRRTIGAIAAEVILRG